MEQVSRKWFSKFTSTLLDYDFIQSKSNYILFRKSSSSTIITLHVYVDDIAIACNNLSVVTSLKTFPQFKFKDIGNLKYILSLKMEWSTAGISLCQTKYTLEILAEYGLLMDQILKLSKSNGNLLEDPKVL